MADENGVVDFTAGFALGALFGAGLALFMAPQSGEETRKDLGKKSKKWKKEAEGRIDEAREAGAEWLEDAEDVVEKWTKEITEAVEDGVKTIREAVEEEIGDLEKKLGKKKKKGLFR